MTPKIKKQLRDELKAFFRKYGYNNYSDNIIDFRIGELIKEFKAENFVKFLYEFLQSELKSINHFKSYNIENLLYILSRIDAKYITEDIYTLLFSICKQKSEIAVIDNCLICFEQWGGELSLKCLNELEFDIDWLNKYRLQIIEDIKQNFLEI